MYFFLFGAKIQFSFNLYTMHKTDFEFSRQRGKSTSFLFFLSKVLVIGYLETKFRKILTVGYKVDLGVYLTRKNHFLGAVVPLRGKPWGFGMGINSG